MNIRYAQLPDGGRQVITFSLPGDIMGLRSVLLRTSDHSFASVSEVTISSIAVPRMMLLFSEFPRLGAALLWAVSRDVAVMVEHLVGLGRRSAVERMAHFFLDLGQRLQLVGWRAIRNSNARSINTSWPTRSASPPFTSIASSVSCASRN